MVQTKSVSISPRFRAFDHNNDGSISKNELRDAMTRYGHTFSLEEAEEMFAEADLNDDGKIDFEEFLTIMMQSHHSVNYATNTNDCGFSRKWACFQRRKVRLRGRVKKSLRRFFSNSKSFQSFSKRHILFAQKNEPHPVSVGLYEFSCFSGPHILCRILVSWPRLTFWNVIRTPSMKGLCRNFCRYWIQYPNSRKLTSKSLCNQEPQYWDCTFELLMIIVIHLTQPCPHFLNKQTLACWH